MTNAHAPRPALVTLLALALGAMPLYAAPRPSPSRAALVAAQRWAPAVPFTVTGPAGMSLRALLYVGVGPLHAASPTPGVPRPEQPAPMLFSFTNVGAQPITFRQGGDGEGFTYTLRGPGVADVRAPNVACTDELRLGTPQTLAAGASATILTSTLDDSGRCGPARHLATRPGTYQLEVRWTTRASVGTGPAANGARGELVTVTGTVTLNVIP